MTKLTDKLRVLKGRWGVVLLLVIAFMAGALMRGGREPERNARVHESPGSIEAAKQETQPLASSCCKNLSGLVHGWAVGEPCALSKT